MDTVVSARAWSSFLLGFSADGAQMGADLRALAAAAAALPQRDTVVHETFKKVDTSPGEGRILASKEFSKSNVRRNEESFFLAVL